MSRCSECGKVNSGYCKPCNSAHWKNNFSNWTSGDFNIDEVIQDLQLNANERWESLEWIEYSNPVDLKHIADGGFGSVYNAVWKDGPLKEERIRKKNYFPWRKYRYTHHCWDIEKSTWNRHSNWLVAVKKFRKATNVSSEFLNEMRTSLNLNISDYVNRIYGVTCDPLTREYAIVTAFQNGGNLRRIIYESSKEITWRRVIIMLRDISRGLADIHARNYYHKDFHSANEDIVDKHVYGVLPFVAPEVLLNKKYSKAADIYGLGIIMYEILSGAPPFIDKEYDQYLALAICAGDRPQVPEYGPEPYVNLMKRSWDSTIANRPTSDEIWNMLSDWSSMNQDSFQKIGFTYERQNQWKERLMAMKENPSRDVINNMATTKFI
ncbi:kinase-like domain-containing protein [Gigaspora rosea]|uniref:Kinase-like domain-containing protein n=1 Tax=Gigaspora rosea TaxID=44941 RepID=A0A397UYA8_9GLOM|nr:kinase-like domain-containing protein [Gigaspora rosea]